MNYRRKVLLLFAYVAGSLEVIRTLFSSTSVKATEVYEVTWSNAEWRKRLSPEQFRVLRNAGTELPFSSPLDHEKRAGVFVCAGCFLPLFSSYAKFNSGTGWPSFWKPLDNSVRKVRDSSFGITRDEILCRRCGSHLGHVFNDGPQPTGLRYCMNGISLIFKTQG